MTPAVLVVDDDEAFCALVLDILADLDVRLLQAASGDEALRVLAKEPVDLVLTDQRMPGLGGLDLARQIRAMAHPAAIVVMTAFGTIPQAVEAVRLGVDDYLTKPLESPAALRELVRRLLGARVVPEGGPGEFLTGDAGTLEMLAIADRAAATDATILITGESGTGKELVARRIHERSPRSEGPFVAVNCAAIPDSLAESEFFGHERGAFTGADARRAGRFEQASGGTLLLDEVGDLPEAVQAKLLRVLEERSVERVGGNTSIPVDLRLVAATNRDLEQKVESGQFRRDLYYRLDVVRLVLKPLRDRIADLRLLVPALLARFAPHHGVVVRTLSADAMARLESHGWPGNVRELRNVLERATIVASGDEIGVEHLPALDRASPSTSPAPAGEAALSLASRERHAILKALERTGGHREKAAGLLGISVRTLYKRLRAYDIR